MSTYTTLKNSNTSPREFVEFWSSLYDYKKEKMYELNIYKKRFSPSNIQVLFEWKNNMILSSAKKISVGKIKKNLNTVNELKRNFDQSIFDKKFRSMSIVWKIFLLHIINPEKFPLYDQHIHRAYLFINNGLAIVPKMTTGEKMSFYTDHYCPFFDKFCINSSVQKRKKADDALWSLGKFLSRYPTLLTTRTRL